MKLDSEQREELWRIAIAFGVMLIITLAILVVAATVADATQLRPNVTYQRHTINHSRVNVVKAPLRMFEALPGCAKGAVCGRQQASLPSVAGARKDAVVSIGGDFVRNGQTVHDFVHHGRTWNRGIRSGDVIYMGKEGDAEIRRGRDWMAGSAQELAGGYPQVLSRGVVPRDRGDCKNDDGPDGAFCLRQPRQGVGLSRSGDTVILIQVDGRQRGSRGVLLPEFGRLFKRFGAYDALNVDGGGSSVMWVRNRARYCMGRGGTHAGCLVSRPVYGERKVAQALAIVP